MIGKYINPVLQNTSKTTARAKITIFLKIKGKNSFLIPALNPMRSCFNIESTKSHKIF
ncbi:MAG TPA: hypothetical protein VHO92_03400 [Methanobacterium sp.]|nr:hypothetical protein [Methanobacterium sp.]